MSKDPFFVFLVRLSALTVLIYGFLFLFFSRVVIIPQMPILLMLLMFFTVTSLSHYIVIKAGEKNPRVFTYSFIGTSTMRLILYSIFLLIYGYLHKDIAKVFVLTFFILYIIYMVFEIRAVQAHLKKKE